MLKILFLSWKLFTPPAYRGHHFAVAYALSKYADVKYYGPGFPEFKEVNHGDTIDVEDVIRRLYPSGDYPNAVIQMSPVNTEGLFWALRNFEKVKCLRVLWASDFHNDIGHPEVNAYMKGHGFDLVIKPVDAKNETQWSKDVESAGIPMEWIPQSIDPTLFYDRSLPKIYDVTNIGQCSPSYYPLRLKIHQYLINQSEIKYRHEWCWGEEYAKVINQSKIFATDTSTFRFAVMKLFEVMACNTLLLSDIPQDAEELGFKSGDTLLEITPDNFMETFRYCLSHPEEVAPIAKRGYDLVHLRHTIDIRAKEFAEKLAKHL